jgi:DNA-binding NarL/FixJ family response regulator
MEILVVDDHPIVRAALVETLRDLDSLVLIVEARDGAEALARSDECSSLDLVLLDLGLPDADGLTILSKLRANHPTIPIVVFSAHDDVPTVNAAFDAGAMGFITKSSSRDCVVNAINLVLGGDPFLPASVLAQRSSAAPLPAAPGPASDDVRAKVLATLTPQQKRVLSCLQRGMPNKTIARELEKRTGTPISDKTVRAHVTAILNKLGVSTRLEAVVRASTLGIRSTDLLDSTSAGSPPGPSANAGAKP